MAAEYLGSGVDDGVILGRSATDKVGFHNAAPTAQGNAITDALTAGSATAALNAAAINSILAVLRTKGIIAT